MIDFVVKFTPDKDKFFETIIRAVNVTEAYLEFVRRYPKEYIITEIEGVVP